MKELQTPRQISDYIYGIMLMDKSNENTEIITANGVVELYNPSFGLIDKRAAITCPIFLSTYYADLKAEYDEAYQNSKTVIVKIQAISVVIHENLLANDIDYYFLNEINALNMSIDCEARKLGLSNKAGINNELGKQILYVKFSDNMVKLYVTSINSKEKRSEDTRTSLVWSEMVIPSAFNILSAHYGNDEYVEYHPNFFQSAMRDYMISLAV